MPFKIGPSFETEYIQKKSMTFVSNWFDEAVARKQCVNVENQLKTSNLESMSKWWIGWDFIFSGGNLSKLKLFKDGVSLLNLMSWAGYVTVPI